MAEYTLMNKNHPVVSFRYDRDIHAVVKIVDVHDLRYAPVALADSKGIVTKRAQRLVAPACDSGVPTSDSATSRFFESQ